MADHRFIRTKIWSDAWFSELSHEARLLYIYLLSNLATHICGYYELTVKEMSFFTGLQPKKVNDSLTELEPNVMYIDGWVCIKNYAKHQNVANNIKVQTLIERELENVPEHVLSLSQKSKSKSEAMDSLSMPYKKEEKVEKSVENVGVYGEFKNVKLSDDEKVKLINKYGRDEAKKLVEELSTYLSSSGKRYKSHYATLLNWARRKGLSIIPSTEPKMIAEEGENGIRLVPNPKYHG